MTVSISKAGQAIQGQQDFNEQTGWNNIGAITVAQALLGATEKDHASVIALADGKGILQMIENGAIAYEWRFRTDGAEDDAPVIDVYKCAGVDHFSHAVQLTLAQGLQQDGNGNFFADQIAAADKAWYDPAFTVQPSTPSDNIASYGLNLYGNDQILFIASSLVVTTIYIDARRLA